jgi:hypothetical protein
MTEDQPHPDADARRAESYATRRRIADEGLAELAKAVAVCGPGATAYAAWIITDKLGLLPEQRVYCCRRPGQAGWLPSHEAAGGTDERIDDAERSFVVKGETFKPFRFKIGFQSLDEYRPQTPEQMKRAADARDVKRAAAEAAKQAEEQAEADRRQAVAALQMEFDL